METMYQIFTRQSTQIMVMCIDFEYIFVLYLYRVLEGDKVDVGIIHVITRQIN